MSAKFRDVAWMVIFVGAGGSGVACGGGVQAAPAGGDAGSEGGDALAPGDARPPVGSDAGDGSCRSTGDCPMTTQGGMMSYCAGPYDWTGCMPGCMPQVVCATGFPVRRRHGVPPVERPVRLRPDARLALLLAAVSGGWRLPADRHVLDGPLPASAVLLVPGLLLVHQRSLRPQGVHERHGLPHRLLRERLLRRHARSVHGGRV